MRRGITLLELLVVMLIMLMVTAAAIPVIAPAMQNRQMRESTRLVSSFIGAAKARAVQTGRPTGFIIERQNGLPFAFTMAQVESPPPYSGDAIGLTATVAALPTRSPNSDANLARAGWPYFEWFKVTFTAPATFNRQLIRVGDTIQLGGQGHLYTIFGPDEPPPGQTYPDGVVDSDEFLEVAYVSRTNFAGHIAFPWLNTPPPQPVAYQIFRQPVRTNSPALTLPEGIAFDLSVSSIGDIPFNTEPYSDPVGTLPVKAPVVRVDPMVLFSPSGRIESVTNDAGAIVRPIGSVYLLLGKRELMFDVTSQGKDSDIVFQNLSAIPNPAGQRQPPALNFWLTVSPQGQVSTAEVAPNFQDYTNSTGLYSTWADVRNAAVTQSLLFAKEHQSLTGR